MNTIVRWVIALLIILSSAELAPAKGRTVDGVVYPSTTLTIKSLIEAQCDEIKVVCPRAVHTNIKCLTPCAMGYRAIIGRNRVLVTHMWPARTVEEFHRRTGLKSLDNPNDALPSLEVIPQVIKDLEKAEAKAEAEKARADALKLEVEALRVEKKKTEDLVEKLKAEKIALEGQVSALKEEGTKMAEQLKLATDTVRLLEEQRAQVAAQPQVVPTTPVTTSAERDESTVSQEQFGFGYWSLGLVVTFVFLVIIFRHPITEKIKDWRSRWSKDEYGDDPLEEDEVVTPQDPVLLPQRPFNFPHKPDPLPCVTMVGGGSAPVRPSPAPPVRRSIPIDPTPVSSNPPDPDATMVFPPVNPSGGGVGDGDIDGEPPPPPQG